MSTNYHRVIPRDLFNEASLLKCLGRLWVETERHQPLVRILHVGNEFRVSQNEDDGSIYTSQIIVIIDGVTYDHYRPLNSRQDWPLWLRQRDDPDADDFPAFDEDGSLSPELLALLGEG